MRLEHRVDHHLRLVLTRAIGILTDDEIFVYRREIWSRSEVTGYDELVAMSDVEHDAMRARLALADAGDGTDGPGPRSAVTSDAHP
jgi:hypothetical protein